MKQISNSVSQISLGAANAFIIEDNGLYLVDTGYPDSKEKIFSALRNAGKDPEQIKGIILTHSHPDHAGSAAALRNALNVPVMASPDDALLIEAGIGGRPLTLSPGILNWLVYHVLIKNSPNEIEPCRIDRRLDDQEVLPIAGGIRILYTPGHTKGHISLLLEKEKLLIAGDICANLMGLDLSIVYEDRATGIESIISAAGNSFDKAVFGHGGALTNGANRKLMQKFSVARIR